jgi:hypothetical protein
MVCCATLCRSPYLVGYPVVYNYSLFVYDVVCFPPRYTLHKSEHICEKKFDQYSSNILHLTAFRFLGLESLGMPVDGTNYRLLGLSLLTSTILAT